MEKFYTYKNAIITITDPNDKQLKRIKKATEEFARRIMKERFTNGDEHPCRNIKEK